MRILLTANAFYVPPRGGATRSNLAWLDRLASAGHECRVVCDAAGEGAAKSSKRCPTKRCAPCWPKSGTSRKPCAFC